MKKTNSQDINQKPSLNSDVEPTVPQTDYKKADKFKGPKTTEDRSAVKAPDDTFPGSGPAHQGLLDE